MKQNNDIITTAREYALKCHRETNHLYDGEPYEVHLLSVYKFGQKYKHLIPEENQNEVLASCWTHDVIEDCRQTYNDVKKVCGETVAEITYALTNEKGKNRKERANSTYYMGIIRTPFATFVKLCDRLANVKHSLDKNSSMLEMYRRENREFASTLWDGRYRPMLDELNQLLK